MIQIRTKKIVKHGIEGRIILSFSGCEVKSDLPNEYLKQPLHCFAGDGDYNDNIIYITGGVNLVAHPDVFYSEESYQNTINRIKLCASELHKISTKKSMEWNGEEEEFI